MFLLQIGSPNTGAFKSIRDCANSSLTCTMPTELMSLGNDGGIWSKLSK